MWTSKLKADLELIGFESGHCIKGIREFLQRVLLFGRDVKLLIAINAYWRHSPNFAGRNSNSGLAFTADEMNLQDVIKIEKPAILSRHFFFPFAVNFLTCFLIKLWPLGVNKCRMASSVVISFGCFFFFGIGAL